MADLMLVALWQAPMADLMLVALWQAPHSWPDVGGVVAGQHVELLLPHREQWVVHHLQHPKQQQHSTLYTVLYNVQQEIKYLLWRDSRASLIQILTLNDNVEDVDI